MPTTKEGHAQHIKHIDGIRLLCALYVILNHIALMNAYLPTLHAPAYSRYDKILLLMYSMVFNYGHYAVDIFIVISGYCLMLPVAQAERGDLGYKYSIYAKRRAYRILPPYYAALFLGLGLAYAERLFPIPLNGPPAEWLDGITGKAIISHLLLLQSWWPAAVSTAINNPLWTISVEWQIYFLFPLLLLPIWRRWGWPALLAFAFGLGILLLVVGGRTAEWSSPWYIGLFGLGMLGAVVNYRPDRPERRQFFALPWKEIVPALLILAILRFALESRQAASVARLAALRAAVLHSHLGIDILIGILAVVTLVHLTESAKRGPTDAPGARGITILARRLLEHPVIVKGGAFSYSLYLIHYPLLVFLHFLLTGTSQYVHDVCMWVIGLPLSIGFAYVFYLLIEKTAMQMSRQVRTRPIAPPPPSAATPA